MTPFSGTLTLSAFYITHCAEQLTGIVEAFYVEAQWIFHNAYLRKCLWVCSKMLLVPWPPQIPKPLGTHVPLMT